MLHHAGDVYALSVGDDVHVYFYGVLKIGIQQHRLGAGHLDGFADVSVQGLGVVDDLHRSSTQNIGWANYHRITDFRRDMFGLRG